jgi:hypothetical protein
MLTELGMMVLCVMSFIVFVGLSGFVYRLVRRACRKC